MSVTTVKFNLTVSRQVVILQQYKKLQKEQSVTCAVKGGRWGRACQKY